MADQSGKKRTADQQLQQNKLLEKLTCPICFEIMSGPIYMCSNHHSMCETCKDKLTEEKCPSCRDTNLSQRNRTLEDLADIVATECPHEGCGVCVVVSKLHTHKTQQCLYAPLKCRVFLEDCGFETASLEDFIAHWQEHHPTAIFRQGACLGTSSALGRLLTCANLTADAFATGDFSARGLLRSDGGGEAYMVCADRLAAVFGQGVRKVYLFQLTKAGQEGRVGQDVCVRLYGSENDRNPKVEVLEVMNARLPPKGFPDAHEDIPLRMHIDITDAHMLRMNGYKGTARECAFSTDRKVYFRIAFS